MPYILATWCAFNPPSAIRLARLDLLRGYATSVATRPARSARSGQSCHRALDQQLPFEQSHRAQDVQPEIARGAAGRHVVKRLEPDASRLEVFEHLEPGALTFLRVGRGGK